MSQPPQPIKMPHGSAAYPWTVTAYEQADGLRVQARIPRTLTREQAEAFLYAVQGAALAFLYPEPPEDPTGSNPPQAFPTLGWVPGGRQTLRQPKTTPDTTPEPIALPGASQPGSSPTEEGRGGAET